MDKYEFLERLHDTCLIAKAGLFTKYATDSGTTNEVIAIGERLRRIARLVPTPAQISRIRRNDAARDTHRRAVEQLRRDDLASSARAQAEEHAARQAAQRRRAVAELEVKIEALESEKRRIEGGA